MINTALSRSGNCGVEYIDSGSELNEGEKASMMRLRLRSVRDVQTSYLTVATDSMDSPPITEIVVTDRWLGES